MPFFLDLVVFTRNLDISSNNVHVRVETKYRVTVTLFAGRAKERHLVQQKSYLMDWRPVLFGAFFMSRSIDRMPSYPKNGVQSIGPDITFANQLRNGFPVFKIASMRSWVFSIPQRLRKASRSRSSTCCSVIGAIGEQSPPVRTRAR